MIKKKCIEQTYPGGGGGGWLTQLNRCDKRMCGGGGKKK